MRAQLTMMRRDLRSAETSTAWTPIEEDRIFAVAAVSSPSSLAAELITPPSAEIGVTSDDTLCAPSSNWSSPTSVRIWGRILWFVPAKLRSKRDQQWRHGMFLGRASGSDQNFVELQNCNVVRARAIARMVTSARWNASLILGIRQTPLTEHTGYYDSIESQKDPHTCSELDRCIAYQEEPARARRVRITLSDIETHGFSDSCPRCALHATGEHRRARFHKHSEACRSRLYQSLLDAGSEKIRVADP